MKEIMAFCGVICATGLALTALTLRDNKECRAESAAEKEAERKFSLERENANNLSKERLFAAKAAAEAAEKAAEKAAAEAKLEATATAAGFGVDEYSTLKAIFETALKKGDLKTATEIGKQLYPYVFQ